MLLTHLSNITHCHYLRKFIYGLHNQPSPLQGKIISLTTHVKHFTFFGTSNKWNHTLLYLASLTQHNFKIHSYSPFLYIAEQDSTIWRHHNLFIHLSDDGCLSCFWFQVILRSCYKYSCASLYGHRLPFLLGKNLEMELLSHGVGVYFLKWRIILYSH